MSDFSGAEERDYVSLRNLKVDFRREDDGEEGDGCFALCFWIYIDDCASFPSSVLVQVQFPFSVDDGAGFFALLKKV